jgi:Arc/MetJ-type ribon-helix-helix transcriptional regulator
MIQLNPETERLVQEELQSGHFHSIDDIILQGIRARREKEQPQRSEAQRRQAVELALDFAKHRAVPLNGVSIKELLHEGHRM